MFASTAEKFVVPSLNGINEELALFGRFDQHRKYSPPYKNGRDRDPLMIRSAWDPSKSKLPNRVTMILSWF